MLLEQAKKVYVKAKIAIGNDDCMRAHILQCLLALITFQSSSGNEIQTLLHKSFLGCLSEIISAGLGETVVEPAIGMMLSAISETREWLPVHCMTTLRHSSDKELQVIVQNFPSHSNKAVGSMKVTPLHIASAIRDPNLVVVRQLLLVSTQMARLKDANGDLPLHYAARWSSSVELMHALLQAYPDGAKIKNNKGETFVHLLCGNKAVSWRNITPLHIAVSIRNLNLAIVRRLLILCLQMAKLQDVYGDLPLHYAARWSNNADLIRELLKAYPDGTTVQNNKGETFLHLLCKNTAPEASAILRMVLSAVPDVVRIQDNNGDLPLHTLVRAELPDAIRVDMAQQLVSLYPEGAAICNHHGHCPVHVLLNKRKDRTVGPILGMMLESNPAAASAADATGRLPLLFVQDTDVAMRLVEAYPEALSGNMALGGTPLHQVAGRDNVDVVHYLYKCRPESLQETNQNGSRVIHFCCFGSSSLAVLRAVYELDPSAISAITNFGWTPLHTLTFNCFKSESAPSADAIDKLYFLLQKYPEAASIPDNDGDTPYSWCHVNHTHARRLLLRAAPALDPETLLELNYSARRTALFLFSEDGEYTLFSKLRESPKGHRLVRRVVEYL